MRDYDLECRTFSWDREAKYLDGLPGNGGLNIAHEALVRHAAGKLAGIPAFRFIRSDLSQQDYTYGDMHRLSSRFANVLLALKLEKGDRVFTLLGRIPELYVSALGTLKAGGIFCPLFSVFGPEPVLQRLSRGDARILVTTTELWKKRVVPQADRLTFLKYVLLVDAPDHLDGGVLSYPLLLSQASESYQIAPTNPEDPALLHFTSGTTGMPKGAVHVHRAVLMHELTGRIVLDFHPGDIFWCTADPGWVTGTSYGIISPLVNGVTSIVDEEEFDAERWLTILQQQRVTVWYTAPTAIRRLMRLDYLPRERYDLSSLRLVCSVGEPLNAEAVVWGERALGKKILDNWWQTETGGILIANYCGVPVKPGSMGRPLPGIEAGIAEVTDTGMKLLEEADRQGNLVIRNGWPSMFRAYLHDPDRYQRSFRDGWYVTGDLARRDADGYFWFVGRADDIIKTSGHLVGPFEVESVLMQHPAIEEAAVIGIPDPVVGERVKAYLVIRQSVHWDNHLLNDVTAFARRNLGTAIAPKEYTVVAGLPKTKSGKVLRRLLKARELGLPEGDLSTLEKS